MQGIEYIGILQHHLVSFLAQCCPLGVFVIIVFDRVEFLFEGIDKRFPSVLCIDYFRFIPRMPIIVSVPLVFDTGEGLKEREGDLFTMEIF